MPSDARCTRGGAIETNSDAPAAPGRGWSPPGR